MDAENFRNPVPQPPVVAVERCEPADIDSRQVAGRRSVDNPLGKRAACTPGGRDPDRVEPGAYIEMKLSGPL